MATNKCIQFKNPKFPHTTLTPKQSRPTLRSARVNPRKSNLAPTPALSTSTFLANFDLGILGASSIHCHAEWLKVLGGVGFVERDGVNKLVVVLSYCITKGIFHELSMQC
ncbi:hypothetical protein Pyn_01420 [Prunus yedoensis var. nudiflora]|uniref:Uncharacterized protein n=1 Tax=Prunus yedoensis var. nudiflora TaxID=2094558 RepID=A0A314Y529_PRUYE|nr:hypothetical protein Pyn_01420 [Prunus yedoensis var. nudiflora]